MATEASTCVMVLAIRCAWRKDANKNRAGDWQSLNARLALVGRRVLRCETKPDAYCLCRTYTAMATVFRVSAAEETQYGGEEVNVRDQRSESIRLQGRKRRNVWLVSRLSSCSSDPSCVGGF
jgi:hypothetical protein